MEFTVITGTKQQEKPKPDYYNIYHRALVKALRAGDILKAVYAGVRLCTLLDTDDYDNTDNAFAIIEGVKSLVGQITPRQLMGVFPIQKVYDGEKWSMKDYYSTMEAITAHGIDKPIGKAASELLWDFMNHDVNDFVVNLMSIVGNLHRRETGRELVTDFFEAMGEPLTTYTLSPSGEYLTNNSTGLRQRIKKSLPRRWKILQGGGDV